MATNQNLIDRALGKIGVVEAGDSANATDSATALDILNSMLNEWAQRDLDLNWFTQDTLGDTAPLPKWAEKGVIANLAMEAAVDFRVPVTGELALEALAGKRVIGNTLINLGLENTDMSHLPQGQGITGRYDINTDN